VLFGLTLPFAPASGFFNVADFGAARDGCANDTAAISKAVAACSAAGGGTVYFPAGRYLSGGVRLESNLTLWLDAGCEVLYSGDPADSPLIPSRWEGTRACTHAPLFHAVGRENVAIVGRGRIDGVGRNWWRDDRSDPGRAPAAAAAQTAWLDLYRRIEAGEKPGLPEFALAALHLRPSLVQFNGCRNILVEGVTLTESPMWLLHPLDCENVAVRGVTFISTGPNGDGIAVDSCRDVRISDCFFKTGDDCIALKAGRDADGRRAAQPTENVTITNCVMHGGHAAIAIGSETAGGIRDVIASNIVARGTERGVRLKSTRGRGGLVENVRFENFVIDDALDQAIEVTARYSDLPPEARSERTPLFRNIAFSHLTIANARHVVSVAGLEEQAIEQVRFTDITAAGSGGFACDCASDVQLTGVRVSAAAGEAFAFSRTQGLVIDGLAASGT